MGLMMKARLALMMKPLEMMNTKPVRVPTVQAPAVMSRKLRGLAVKQKGQPPRAAKVPQNLTVRCQSVQPHHQERQGKTQLQKKGCAGWKEHDKMHGEHGKPFKELQN